MARYAVIDAENIVQNLIEWDGVAEWSPPDGQTALLDTDPPTAQLSYIYDPSTQTFSVGTNNGE